jgi:hypothetical protein
MKTTWRLLVLACLWVGVIVAQDPAPPAAAAQRIKGYQGLNRDDFARLSSQDNCSPASREKLQLLMQEKEAALLKFDAERYAEYARLQEQVASRSSAAAKAKEQLRVLLVARAELAKRYDTQATDLVPPMPSALPARQELWERLAPKLAPLALTLEQEHRARTLCANLQRMVVNSPTAKADDLPARALAEIRSQILTPAQLAQLDGRKTATEIAQDHRKEMTKGRGEGATSSLGGKTSLGGAGMGKGSEGFGGGLGGKSGKNDDDAKDGFGKKQSTGGKDRQDKDDDKPFGD